MRPVSNFLIMQLSNSRVEKGSKFQIYNEIGWWSPDCEVSITTTSEETVLIPDEEDADIGHRYIWSTNIESDCTITISANWDMSNKLIIPSLTVEKKNECHNP